LWRVRATCYRDRMRRESVLVRRARIGVGHRRGAPLPRLPRAPHVQPRSRGWRVFSRSQTDRCRVVDRRDATMRRYDSRRPGRNRDCLRLPGRNGDAQAHTWLVRSKRKGEGTAFFVPVQDVRDWTYPFLYGFVRDSRGEIDLPKVEWTQLFVDRLYQGLYLRVALPFDLRRKDGGSGTLRELLTIRERRSLECGGHPLRRGRPPVCR